MKGADQVCRIAELRKIEFQQRRVLSQNFKGDLLGAKRLGRARLA